MERGEIRKAALATIETIAPETDLLGIRPDRPLRVQVELDSMDWLNVIAGLHDRLSIENPESGYARLTTLDAIVDYLASTAERRPEKPQPAAALAPLPRTCHQVNGTEITVRPIRADDMPLEAHFVRHRSSETRHERFMVTVRELSPKELRYLTDVNQMRHVALVATTEHDGQEALVGIVRYIVDPTGDRCEFAVAIDDSWHGSGLACILMQALIDVARGPWPAHHGRVHAGSERPHAALRAPARFPRAAQSRGSRHGLRRAPAVSAKRCRGASAGNRGLPSTHTVRSYAESSRWVCQGAPCAAGRCEHPPADDQLRLTSCSISLTEWYPPLRGST